MSGVPWRALLIGTTVLAASIFAVFAVTDEASVDTSEVSIPAIREGALASYTVQGPPRSIGDPTQPFGPANASDVETIRLEARTATVPTGWPNGTRSAIVVDVLAPNGSFQYAAAAGQAKGFLTVEPEDIPTNTDEGFEPMDAIRVEPTAGPLDVFLFAGTDPEPGTAPLIERIPWASELGRDIDRSPTDATVTVTATGDETRVEVATLPKNQTATYRFDADCPFPASIRHTSPDGRLFSADRTSCATGNGAEFGPSPTTPEITQTFDHAFPGQGYRLPLPYRPALEFFKTLPDVQAFIERNPDWRTTCVVNTPHPTPGVADRVWFFNATGENESASKWITRTQSPIGEGEWTVHPSPPETHFCQPDVDARTGDRIPKRPPDRGDPVASIDRAETQFRQVLVRDDWQSEANRDAIGASGGGYSLLLSRCSEKLENRSGICTEILGGIDLSLTGQVETVTAERDWLAEPYRSLLPRENPTRSP